ncbi:MAG: hypothetical protein ACI9Y1_003158 [Lentisphaeria bacterium]|jgi:hypothetical protein
MKTYISVIFSLVFLVSQNALAHSDHAHGPITETQALSLTAEVAKQLTEKDAGLEIGQLPVSWASVAKENIATFKKGKGYYVMSVDNKSETKTLYVLMSSTGEVYDANFSGIFKGVE